MKNFSLYLFLFALLFVPKVLQAQGWEYKDSGTTFILYDLSIPEGQNEIAYAAGAQFTSNSDGIIIKSVNGGESWSTIYPTSGTIDGIEKIEFLDTMTGYAVGYDLFIKTVDGGQTWTDVVVAADVWYYKSLNFFDANIGIVTVFTNGGGFEVYTTSDGGVNWSPIESTANMPTFAVDYADATTLFAVGANEVISKSEDSGETWSVVYTGTPTFFNLEVYFTNVMNGIVSGEDGTILATYDGGNSWGTFSTGYHNFYALGGDDFNTLFAGGTDQDVYISVDGGSDWILEHDGENVATFYDIEFFSNGNALVCGSQGRMLKYEPLFGVDEFTSEEKIKTSYNANSNLLTVASSEVISEIHIHTLDGKKVLQLNNEAAVATIDMAPFSNGLYIITASVNNQRLNAKFVKH